VARVISGRGPVTADGAEPVDDHVTASHHTSPCHQHVGAVTSADASPPNTAVATARCRIRDLVDRRWPSVRLAGFDHGGQVEGVCTTCA
jgi:hypothetical protein